MQVKGSGNRNLAGVGRGLVEKVTRHKPNKKPSLTHVDVFILKTELEESALPFQGKARKSGLNSL